MKIKRLGYKLCYEMRNYYLEHKYIVYLPLLMILGFVAGIIIVANNGNQIANFIDSALEDEYSFGGAFMREFSLYIIVLISANLTLFSRYFHILGCGSLVLIGYRFGYILTSLVVGGVAGGIIQIIIVNIPFILVASIVLTMFYSYIASSPNIFCLKRSGKYREYILNLLIYTAIYIFIIVYFQILVPRFYILIFL